MTPDLPAVEVAIVKETNDFRRQQNLNPVKRNRQLDLAARRFARYLAKTGKFSHTADGRQPSERIASAGYEYCRVAENLAMRSDSRGFQSQQLARLAVEGWKKSPGHRRNMMLRTVTEIGVGVARADNEHRYLSVQLFGRPKALQYKFEVRNETGQRINYTFDGRNKNVPARAYVQITVCAPGQLSFPKHVSPANQPDRPAHFTTSAGDRFVISIQNQGLIVSRTP